MAYKFSGQRLRALREERGWSQYDVARQAGVREQNIGRWERGESTPRAGDFMQLVAVFGVPPDQLADSNGDERAVRSDDDDEPQLVLRLAG